MMRVRLETAAPLSQPNMCNSCTCVTAHGGHMEVTPDIDLDSMKYKGSLIFGS